MVSPRAPQEIPSGPVFDATVMCVAVMDIYAQNMPLWVAAGANARAPSQPTPPPRCLFRAADTTFSFPAPYRPDSHFGPVLVRFWSGFQPLSTLQKQQLQAVQNERLAETMKNTISDRLCPLFLVQAMPRSRMSALNLFATQNRAAASREPSRHFKAIQAYSRQFKPKSAPPRSPPRLGPHFSGHSERYWYRIHKKSILGNRK